MLAHAGVSQNNCDLKKDDDGINVYLCDSEIGNFKTIIVEMDMPATLSQYAAMVLDIDSYHLWQYNAIGPRLVTQISKTELYYYSEVDTPWPSTNRDMIWHLNMSQNPETKVLASVLTIYPDYIPKVEGVVRIPKANALLTVTPIDKTNVHIRYVLDIDPGGSVPAWLTNMFAAMAPWHTYNNLRDQIIAQGEDRKSLPFIENY
jgi:hypothetical protein